MTRKWVGLADAICALRQQLLDAVAEGEGSPMKFRLEPVELSLEVAVAKGADGKIGWKVLEFGGSRTSTNTQTLKLRLEPQWLNDDGSYTNDFLIADQTAKSPTFGSRTPFPGEHAAPSVKGEGDGG